MVVSFHKEYLVLDGGCLIDGDEIFLIVLHMEDRSEAIIWDGQTRQDAIREAADIARREGLHVFDKTGRPQ